MADSIKVQPPALLEAASQATMQAETAAAPRPGMVPIASPGSPADAAAAPIATGMGAKSAALTAQLARKAPQLQAATHQGVAQLQSQDERNATQIRQLAQNPLPHPTRPHGGIQAVDNHHTFKQEPPPPPPPVNPDPLGRLGLPPYNPASLPGEEARRVYGIGKLRIIEQDEQLARQGVSLEQRAKLASESRNALRSWIRAIQSDQVGAAGLDRSDPNMNWDQVVKKYQDQGFKGMTCGAISSTSRRKAAHR